MQPDRRRRPASIHAHIPKSFGLKRKACVRTRAPRTGFYLTNEDEMDIITFAQPAAVDGAGLLIKKPKRLCKLSHPFNDKAVVGGLGVVGPAEIMKRLYTS